MHVTTAALLHPKPLVLAKYDGRFYEVYAADDDFSYSDALLLGERVYRRDLLSGDSVLVFSDTTVPRFATAYARTHPEDEDMILRHVAERRAAIAKVSEGRFALRR
jgi:hypothetical protein